MSQVREFLRENGYDLNIVGSKYFVDIFEEIVDKLLDDYDISEIKEIYPALCLEYYHFYYEVPRMEFLNEIDYFSQNGYRGKSDIEIKLWNEPTIDKLIRLGNRYIHEQKQIESNKQLVKSQM